MDIDRLILIVDEVGADECFGSLMDIDRLIPRCNPAINGNRFGSLMDIDRLILAGKQAALTAVLVL